MSISYANTPFKFVDSQFGTASGNDIKKLVNVVVDQQYHREVQIKNWFRQSGMIGEDPYQEGDGVQTKPGYPVIRKTQLQVNSGDTIKMGLRKNLSFSINTGIVGGFQLVDSEVGWTYDNQFVKIEQWRQGVRTDAGMNAQRNPYGETFEQTEISLLSDWSAQQEDNGILYAAHSGFSPQLYRQYGTSNQAPTANVNTIFGNDQTLNTALTVANLDNTGLDNPNEATFDIVDAYMNQLHADPVVAAGGKFWICLVSPKFILKWRQASNVRSAFQLARERGVDNPLFQAAEYIYGNCLIYSYDKIRTILAGNNPAGLTVTNAGTATSQIVEASYTGLPSGVTSAQLHQMIVLGSNALCLAEGKMRMAERIENDYGQIIGRAADNIWGAKRADWNNEAGTIDTNQGGMTLVNTLI